MHIEGGRGNACALECGGRRLAWGTCRVVGFMGPGVRPAAFSKCPSNCRAPHRPMHPSQRLKTRLRRTITGLAESCLGSLEDSAAGQLTVPQAWPLEAPDPGSLARTLSAMRAGLLLEAGQPAAAAQLLAPQATPGQPWAEELVAQQRVIQALTQCEFSTAANDLCSLAGRGQSATTLLLTGTVAYVLTWLPQDWVLQHRWSCIEESNAEAHATRLRPHLPNASNLHPPRRPVCKRCGLSCRSRCSI